MPFPQHSDSRLRVKTAIRLDHVPPRFERPTFRFPKIEFRVRKSTAAAEPITGRTYTLREPPPPRDEDVIDEFVPRKIRRRFVDWRGIGILVTRREFLDRAIGITGELLMTAGVFVLLFLGWHVWFNDIVQGAAQDRASAELSDTWTAPPAAVTEFDRALGTSDGAAISAKPPVLDAVKDASAFATIIIPRFGTRYERTVAESVDVKTVLNNHSTGVGHYTDSQQLGEIGNFAVAGHRTTYGAAFGEIDTLRVGDRIYIETEAGWYVYRFRNLEFVYPNEVSVLNPVPQLLIGAKDRILTMTSCHPKLSAAERIIAYALFESFVPRENGAPAEITRVSLVNG